MGRSLHDITADLARVTDALLAVEPDDFAGRYELLRRQDELRAEADSFHTDFDAQRSTADLLAELAELRRRRDAAIARGSGRVMLGTGGGAAFVGPEMVKLSARVQQSSNLHDLNVRISTLESILITGGVDVEKAADRSE